MNVNTPSPKSDFCFWQNSALISRFLIFMFSVDLRAFSASAAVANSMKANLQQKQTLESPNADTSAERPVSASALTLFFCRLFLGEQREQLS